MARIINSSFKSGTTIDNTDLNNKFADVTIATTTALNNENARQEAVDLQALAVTSTTSGIADLILKNHASHFNKATPTSGYADYDASVGPNPTITPINHGTGGASQTTGFSLAPDDLVRVHWMAWMDKIITHGGVAVGAGAINSGLGQLPPRYPAWVIWLQWQINTVWAAVPGQSDFDATFGTNKGALISDLQACVMVPHMELIWGTAAAPRGTWVSHRTLSNKGSWNYINDTGSSITVTGLRLVIDGVYHPLNDGTTGNENALVHENLGWTTSPQDNVVRLSAVQLQWLQMRSD